MINDFAIEKLQNKTEQNKSEQKIWLAKTNVQKN